MRHLLTLFREEQRQDRADDPDPDERDTPDEQHYRAADEVRLGQVDLEKERGDAQNHGSVKQAVDDGERRMPSEMRKPGDRRHERILDRAFPALHSDDVREPVKDDGEIAPENRPDDEVQNEIVAVDTRVAKRPDTRSDKGDRETVRHRIAQPDEFPGPISLDQIQVPLDKAV